MGRRNILIIYPRWPKIPQQTEFHLPPHGPVCMAASIPDDYEIEFIDENVQSLPLRIETDLVFLSVMLTCQLPRALEIAALVRRQGIKVVAGGIAAMLHAEEVRQHVDACFLGETEGGRLGVLLADWERDDLKDVYDFMQDQPDIESVGPARRDILNYDFYSYRGLRMVDLVHASRGCRFNCFPCATAYLGGRRFRPRPLEKVVEEVGLIDNDRLFFVDNSLAQDRDWVMALFDAIGPLKRHWISHPILDEEEVVKKAAAAGCWYVYQAIFDTSDVIRNRVKRLKDHGIGVEAAVLLGTDNQDEDYIRKLVDFLLEIDVDMAEFSILTPFPHTPVTAKLDSERRILHRDWRQYTTTNVCFVPKHMSCEKLQEMYSYAWRAFYQDMSAQLRMARLFANISRNDRVETGPVPSEVKRIRGWGGDAGKKALNGA